MRHQWEAPGGFGIKPRSQRVLGMKLGAACLLCLLLTCLPLPVTHGRIRERSMENRSKGLFPPPPCLQTPLHPQIPLH